MAVDNTLLLREVDSIINNGVGVKYSKIECNIRVGKEWITPARIILHDVERDYENNYGDVNIIEVSLGMGDYAYRVIPAKDNIVIDITITPIYRNNETTLDTKRRTRRYRAILMEQSNPGLVGRMPYSGSISDLNLSGQKNVQFQLLNESSYQIRMTTVGGLYRNTVPLTLLKSFLTETTRFSDYNNQQQIFGVDVVPGFNPTPRNHIIIHHGTPLTSLSNVLQNEHGGVYSTGCGCYLQDSHWYVFPLYDTSRWNKTPNVLTILNVPSGRYFGAEQTYRYTKNQVTIITAGDSDSQDVGLYNQLNEGNGYRFADANALLSMGNTAENKTAISRRSNVFEFEGTTLKGGKKNIQWAKENATANPFKYYSEIAQRSGRYVSVQWMHGDANLLYPGMPVKYVSTVEGRLVTFYGVLLGLQEQRVSDKAGIITDTYNSLVQLKLFLTRNDTVV